VDSQSGTTSTVGRIVRRRRLMIGLSALSGIVAATLSERTVEAAPLVGDGVIGVQGNGSTVGVAGYSTTNDGRGLFGSSPAGIGIHGQTSGGGYGGVFESLGGGSGSIGLVLTATNGIAFVAQTSAAAADAAVIQNQAGGRALFAKGDVHIDGDLAVTGQKSAAVPNREGKLVKVYCLESPQSYFEDFGREQTVGGRVTVQIRDDFTALVRKNEYFVFLTPEADSPGLFVANYTAASFDVVVAGGSKASIPFSYRIVAERGDIEAPRLPVTRRSEIPTIRIPPLNMPNAPGRRP